MAIVKSTRRRTPPRAPRPIGPMRAVHLRQYSPLDRWLAGVEMKTAPEVYLHSPLPEDQAMVELFVFAFEGMLGSTYRLTMWAFHPGVGTTDNIVLARFVGSPHGPNAPLWVRRLPQRKFLRFSQPLEFVAKLVGGMMDNVPVKSLLGIPADEIRMKSWARDALATDTSFPDSQSPAPYSQQVSSSCHTWAVLG
ncbi:hypothetical protein C8F04DRAFT_1188415 [Mycena alexandri]|uniref:Uncharacterized protein n=1 Tax=Mycena alexandri TaxID=1745969 RepID=A0AAD6SIE9_9AGAR|nr:hypothetical protein C8F04DRAFT_1188415 [Mycena alexandri]